MPDSTAALINSLTNPPNPLNQFGGTLDLANKLMDYRANQAAADAYRQSIRPDGSFDQGLFNSLTSQAPGGSWQFGKRMLESGEGFRAQGAGTQQDIQAKQQQLQAAGEMLYPLYQRALVGAVPASEVQAAFDQAHDMGLINDQQYQRTSKTLSDLGPNGDARGIVLGANMGNQAAQRLAVGQPQYVQQGTSLVPVNPAAGSVGTGNAPTIRMGLTPEQWSTEIIVPDASGVPTRRRLGDFLGVPPPAGVGGTPSTGAPGPQSSTAPPTTPGSSAGGENREVATNNFAGMRNPNVPAAGGPITNPQGWQVFDTPEHGVQAISHQLDRYASGATTGKPLTTLNGIISTWAPPNENDTPALIARASKIMGVGPNDPLDLSNPDVKAKLVEAMIRNEQGGNLPKKAADAIPGALNAPNWKPYGTTQTVSDVQPSAPAGGSARPGGTQTASAANAIPQPPAPGQPTNINQPTPPVQVGQTGAPPVPSRDIPTLSPYVQPQFELGAKDYAASLETDKTLGTRTKPLVNAVQILRNNPATPVGPAAKDWAAWQTALHDVFGIDIGTQGATTYQELAKQLAQNAVVQNMASQTDLDRLNKAAAQPNPEMSRDAIITLAAEQIGMERIKSAQYRYFRSLHPGKYPAADSPEQNTQYFNMETGDWAAQQDPMAYAIDLIPRKALVDYVNNPDKDFQSRFGESMNNAKKFFKIGIPSQGAQ